MQVKVSKWGNSLGVRIPQHLAEQAKLNDGTVVEIAVRDGVVFIERNRPSLDELIEGITADNLHKETDSGSPVGREIW